MSLLIPLLTLQADVETTPVPAQAPATLQEDMAMRDAILKSVKKNAADVTLQVQTVAKDFHECKDVQISQESYSFRIVESKDPPSSRVFSTTRIDFSETEDESTAFCISQVHNVLSAFNGKSRCEFREDLFGISVTCDIDDYNNFVNAATAKKASK